MEMNIKTAIELLKRHNKWRRGCDITPMVDPKDLGEAIDKVIEELESNKS